MAAALKHLNNELVLMGYRRTPWPLIAMRLTSAAPRQTVDRVHAKVLNCREKYDPLLLGLRSWENAANHISNVKPLLCEMLYSVVAMISSSP